MFAFDPGQHRGDVAVLAIKGEAALRVVPGKTRETPIDGRNREGRRAVRWGCQIGEVQAAHFGRLGVGGLCPSFDTGGQDLPSPWRKPSTCFPMRLAWRSLGRFRPGDRVCLIRQHARAGNGIVILLLSLVDLSTISRVTVDAEVDFPISDGIFPPKCWNAGVFEIGVHLISMPYPNRNCETEPLFMRLAKKPAEVFETNLQPYGS